ncbi:hypothetical protein DH2020_039551 [Rehmannia glutinosa]|uniref:Retrotransposon Copia-like N-terminal domain-containing protein n=1 Tax=Rehmannia glutinosa TaxID=99300 RepID=A0ABR0UXQ8_REHGL
MALTPPGSTISTTSSPSPVQLIQPQSQLIVTKLTESNYLIWKQKIISAVRGYGLEGYLNGEITPPRKFITSRETPRNIVNPEYATFQRHDQLLMSWLLSSLSDNILVLMVGLDSGAEMWHTLETNFSSRSQAKRMQYKLQLSTMKKGNQSMREFINKVKLCCDALCAAGHKVKEVDQVLHVCAGLTNEYDPIVCAITSRTEPLSLSDASALLEIGEMETLLVTLTSEKEAPLEEEGLVGAITGEEEAGSKTMVDKPIKFATIPIILQISAITEEISPFRLIQILRIAPDMEIQAGQVSSPAASITPAQPLSSPLLASASSSPTSPSTIPLYVHLPIEHSEYTYDVSQSTDRVPSAKHLICLQSFDNSPAPSVNSVRIFYH